MSDSEDITTKIFKRNKQPPYNRTSQTLVSGVDGRNKTGYHTRHVKKMPPKLVSLLCDVVVRYQAQATVNVIDQAPLHKLMQL